MIFASKSDGKIILVLEIQSSIARSSLIWQRPGQPSHVFFVDERAIPFKQDVGSTYFIKTTLKALSQTIDVSLRELRRLVHEKKHADMPHHIEEVHYVLSSPWIASQARTLSLSFEKNTAITRDKINDILATERSKLVPDSNGPLETLEEKIFDVRLNGYSVSSWEGKQARLLEVSYAVTVGGSDTMKRFREACEHIVRASKVHFHSSLLLQFVGLRTAMPSRDMYTLVHIHGELTDVLSVKHGSCTFFGSYPMGVNTIIRKIARATKTDVQTADSLLSLYLGGRLEEQHAKTVMPIMDSMSAGWSGELGKLFKDASAAASLEYDTIIAARAHEDFFVKSFKAAHPVGRVEAWAASEAMPAVTFESTTYKMRIVSVYAVALHELEAHRF